MEVIISKAARVIGIVASVVAVVATGGVALGAILGGTMMFAGVSAATIAAVAGAVSAIATTISQATMKPPDLKGSVSSVVIGANLPVPLMLGLTFAGGVLVYDKAAPPVDNKNRTQIMVVSAAGPIESFDKIYADFSPITFATESGGLISGVASGFYGADGGYLWANSRKGARPDTALTPAAGRPAFRNWDSTYKLSGLACYCLTAEFDEDGKRFASGLPAWGILGKGVKVYDPRADSTYPGGLGAQRFADETTWAFSENPALQYLAYARGWFQAGKKLAGCGLAQESIWLDHIVAWANVCDTNGWKSGGTIWDGSGINRWDNLKRLAQAGGAEPVWTGGKLGVSYSSPKTSVFTITADDLADGEVSVQAMDGFRDRVNTAVARVRSSAHRWEYIQLEALVGSTYVTEDGETKTREMQFDMVQQSDQGAELAALHIADSREFGPISIPLKPKFMLYRPGEAGIVNLPEIGLNEQLCVITARAVDPATATVTLTLRSETTAKHAWALTQTGIAPPSPTLFPPEEVDEAVSGQQPEAATITLTPSANGFTFIDFVPADANAVITVDATQNRAGTLVWSVSPAVTLGVVDADTRTLSLANFGSNQNVTITATNELGAVASLVLGRIDITTPMDSIIPDAHFVGGISDGTATMPPFISSRFTRFIP